MHLGQPPWLDLGVRGSLVRDEAPVLLMAHVLPSLELKATDPC